MFQLWNINIRPGGVYQPSHLPASQSQYLIDLSRLHAATVSHGVARKIIEMYKSISLGILNSRLVHNHNPHSLVEMRLDTVFLLTEP